MDILFSKAESEPRFDPDKLPEFDRLEALRVGHLLFLGRGCFDFLKTQGLRIQFTSWKEQVIHAAPEYDLQATDDEWLWVWESLQQCKSVTEKFGKLPTAGVRWKTNNDRFNCLPAGSIFGVAIKQSELKGIFQTFANGSGRPTVCVKTLSPLRMKPGKAKRLECCDTQCEVTISVAKPFSAEREADIMRIELGDIIERTDTFVRARVKSLNQAYTIASRRLEPERRSHGGRTYDKFVYFSPQLRKTWLLDKIREQMELGTWQFPQGPIGESSPSFGSEANLDEND